MTEKTLTDLLHALNVAAAELIDASPMREDAHTVRLARLGGRFVTTLDLAHPTDPHFRIDLVVGEGDAAESAIVFRCSANAPTTFGSEAA